MTGRIFLAGGGGHEDSFEVDEVFLEGVSRILYIPWAWHDDNFSGCLKWFNEMIEKHNAKSDVKMLSFGEIVDIGNYDAVYVGGGNTFKLLKRLREKGIDRLLRAFYEIGGKIYGGSAGAIIWGSNIKIAFMCSHPDENKIDLKDTTGFNIFKGYDVQPHWEDRQEEEHLRYVNETGRGVLGIPEESAVIVSGEGYKIIGAMPIAVINKLGVSRYNAGELLKL